MPFLVRCLLLFSVLSLGLFSASDGNAQALQMATGGGDSAGETAPVLPEELTPEVVDDLVARMSDAEVRELLLQRLDAVAAAQAETGAEPRGLIANVAEAWSLFAADMVDVVSRVPNLLSSQGEVFQNFANSYSDTGLLVLFGLIAVALAAGLAAEWVVKFAISRWRGNIPEGEEGTLWSALSFLFQRFLREIAGLIGFYLGVRTVGLAILNPQQLAFAAPFLTYLIWFPRLGAAVGRFILAPKRSEMRLVNVDDHWANYLQRNLVGLVLLAGFSIFIVRFNSQNGMPMGETRIGFWLNTAVHIYIGVIAWTARAGLVDMMRGTDPDRTPFDEKIALAYPYFAVAVTIVMWVVVELVAGYGNVALLLNTPHYTTMFWLLMAPALDTMIRGLVRHLQPPMSGEGPIALAAYKSTKRSFIRIGRVLVAGVVILLIAGAWQINLFSLTGEAEGAGANLFQFLLTLAVGYVVFEGVSLWINRRLAKEFTSRVISEDEAQGEGGGAGGSRLATVLPLMRITAQSAIAVVFGLLAIGSLGIDITPLLAGAGILGLAIGFGAQKLVSDVVSGVFFLIDDAFRVGEYVEVDGTAGTVEKISIRSMQLRHHRGPVHTIPYGEIPKLTNYSRDWVIMKLKFTVPFDTDPNKVKKIFKQIGAEMSENPLFKDDFLQPFKSQGVLDFDDVGMIVRGKFMAKPGTQFTIRKEIFNKVKNAFNEAGIEFARREVRVAIPDMHDEDTVTEAEATAIKAAAAEAAAQQARDKEV